MNFLTSYRQTQFVIWINQLLFFIFLIGFFDFWMIPCAVISLYIFGFMSESSLHRYFTHKSFETTNFKVVILKMFAFLTGQGATISWVTVHRTHHAYEDTEKDPHSPYHLSWWKIYLALLPKNYKNNLILDLIKSRHWNYFVFENKFYFFMWCAVWIITYLINFNLFFFLVSGSATWYIATCAINILSHRYIGYKSFPESVGLNSKIVNFFTGVGHHNNHHKNPKSFTYSMHGELDVYGAGIRLLFAR